MGFRERDPRIDRVGFELRTTGVPIKEANSLRSGIHTRGYLPHVKREGARYFVTFRLADSLPKAFLLKVQAERATQLRRILAEEEAAKDRGKPFSREPLVRKVERDYFRKLETFLDKGCGQCWLKRPQIARIVVAALRFFEGKRYLLDEWVVMPNHVHVVLWPMPNQTLSGILHSWKRFVAREANRILGRTGTAFWQPESYDHWIRTDDEHARCCRYVANNPVNAGLCAAPDQWEWGSAWKGAAS